MFYDRPQWCKRTRLRDRIAGILLKLNWPPCKPAIHCTAIDVQLLLANHSACENHLVKITVCHYRCRHVHFIPCHHFGLNVFEHQLLKTHTAQQSYQMSSILKRVRNTVKSGRPSLPTYERPSRLWCGKEVVRRVLTRRVLFSSIPVERYIFTHQRLRFFQRKRFPQNLKYNSLHEFCSGWTCSCLRPLQETLNRKMKGNKLDFQSISIEQQNEIYQDAPVSVGNTFSDRAWKLK